MNQLNQNIIDAEYADDLIVKLEDSFAIKFEDQELTETDTYGKLCDLIKYKIKLRPVEDCTTQQAFYKVRSAICSSLKLEKQIIKPDSSLFDLLPRKNRKLRLKKIEEILGFKVEILRPPKILIGVLILIIVASLFVLAVNWEIGLAGIVISLVGLKISRNIGIELKVKTVGQLAEFMKRENYVNSRRHSDTFNVNEVEEIITDLFSDYLAINKSELTRDAKFV